MMFPSLSYVDAHDNLQERWYQCFKNVFNYIKKRLFLMRTSQNQHWAERALEHAHVKTVSPGIISKGHISKSAVTMLQYLKVMRSLF